jgi:hypothetical protein
VADSILVQFLGKEYLGPRFVLGFEISNDEVYVASGVEGKWRKCGKCKNIWQEDIGNKISRCPDCGAITKLLFGQGDGAQISDKPDAPS